MSRKFLILILLGAAVVGATAVAGRRYFSHRPAAPKITASGFQEDAAAAGITFRMRFLEGEQGEHFKANLYDHGAGLAVADYDGDGYDDVYFVNQLGSNALYRNRGDGTFEEVTAKAGVGLEDRICVCATWADYDNDEDPDLFVTSTRGGNVLFRNDGRRFTDVTREAGVAHVGHSQTGAFFDYDNDGRLDLFVANTADWTAGQYDPSAGYFPGKGDAALGSLAGSKPERNLLYHNEGGGKFREVSRAAGVGGEGWSADVAVFDYAGDGYQDLLVSRMFGAAQLFQNQRNGTFKDVTMQVLGRTPWGGMGVRVFDYDGDGLLDLAIVDMHSDMWMGVDRDQRFRRAMLDAERKKYPQVSGPLFDIDPVFGTRVEDRFARDFNVQYKEVVFGNVLFRNLGEGKFREVSDAAGFETMWPWGCAPGDFDGDGDEDVFMPAGMGYPYLYWPNYLLINDGGGRFVNRARELGVEPPPGGESLGLIAGRPAAKSSRCAVTADFDRDGRLDLMINNFNDGPYYFRNRFPKQNYISFRLVGTRCCRDAVGAVVRLRVGDRTLTRQVQSVGGYLSQSSSVMHFGLGKQDRVDRVEIVWPGGDRQTLDNPGVNAVHGVTQGEPRR
jgi:enediyne biosynthesis protein E4